MSRKIWWPSPEKMERVSRAASYGVEGGGELKESYCAVRPARGGKDDDDRKIAAWRARQAEIVV